MSISPQSGRPNTSVHGVFLNTAKAQCSIHESGRMVFRCIDAASAGGEIPYRLDYFSIDEIDLGSLIEKQKVKPLDPARSVADSYDFWVLNWHPITMAPLLAAEHVRALPGKKFTIVLEVEPGNPLLHVAAATFDGHMVLDPTVAAADGVFPFPRPLEGRILRPGPSGNPVPVIGSFGFGTPGKGFELVVDAVNREFDAAKIRINVPAGTYADDTMFGIHQRNYPRHLADMCRRIAKPGVEVEFTYDFLTPDGLLDWCAGNDLNCFLYTRRMSGLSATTDQAVASGRALVVSSNDTFRHIHRYIPPYPITSLRAALAETVPVVRRIQEDWSRTSFLHTFQRMLAACGLMPAAAGAPEGAAPLSGGGRRILVAGPVRRSGGDLLDYPNRVAACLGRSPQYQVSHTPRLVPDEVIASGVEAVVVVMPGPDDLAAVGLLRRHSLPVVVVSAAAARDAPSAPAGNGAPVLIERRPLIPYFTAVVKLPSGPPAIWLVGFANAPAALDAAIGRIQAEGLAANILVEGPAPGSAGWAGFEARIGQIAARLAATTPTIRVVPRVLASLSAGEVVVECAAGRLVVFHDDPTRGDELGDLCDLALTTERAVVFSRAAPLPRYAGQGTYFEDFSIAELMEQGVAAQIHLYNSFAEGRFFGTLDHLLSGLLPARSKAVPRESAPVPTLAAPATPGARELLALEGEAFIEAAFRLLLGRAPDPDGRRHYLAMLNRGVSRGYIAAEIRMSAEGRARGVDLSGLEAEIRRYGWLRRPVIGRLLRLAGQGRDPSRPASRPATVGPVSLAQLLAEHDEAFVRAAYQAILGRAPDSEGLAYYLRVLRDGGSPLSILARLRFSPEGRRVGVGVDGLDRALWRHRLERWPVVGVLARLGSSEHDPTQRRLRAIEARLHQVLATGHQRFDRIETMAQTLDDNVGKLETALRRLGRRPASRRPAGVSRPRTVSPRREPRLYYLLPSDDSAPSSLAMLVTQRLGQGLLDARQSVRFVVWDDAAKELRLVHREVLAAWDDPQHPLFGPQDLTVYPSRAQSAVTVDAKAVQPGDWLLVATIPSEDQLGPLGAVELVLAGRRLGCALAFLFYDAGPLRVMGHKLADQYERYMQALLLVDVVLAASPEAADEVLTFLVRHQHAAALPRIQSLPLPGQINLQDRPAQAPAQPGIDWCGYARRLAAELKTVAAAPLSGFDGVYYWVTDTSVNPHNSGVQRVVRQMARGLIRCGVRVIPVRWDPDRQSLVVPTQAHLDHLSRWGGVRPEDWSPWVPPGTSGAPRWLLVPEVVHGVLGTVRETVARQGLRCAAVFYDTIPHKMRETFSAEFSENHRYYLDDVARFDKVLSISHFSHEELRLYCLGTRARTPSVEHRFRPVPLPTQHAEYLRAATVRSTPAEVVRILAVISIEPRKNPLVLLDAFETAARRSPRPLELTLVGRSIPFFSELAGQVTARVNGSPAIRWEQGIDDQRLHQLFEEADFTVFPSLEEGFGLPIVESLWNGRPCIVHHAGSMAEIAEDGGCLEIDMHDPAALTEAILDLATDDGLRLRLAHDALARPIRSWEDYALEIALELATDRLGDLVYPAPSRPALSGPVLLGLRPRPTLSLCISTYNRGSWLAVNLRILFDQISGLEDRVEILVVDNTSTDDTEEIMSSLGDGRPYFRYVRNEKNVGMLGNLTVTAHLARGDYIWILGDDDLLKPGALRTVLDVIDSHPGVSLVYPHYAYTFEKDPANVGDIEKFAAACPTTSPPTPDQFGLVREIATNNENLFTAIYCLVFRRDHGLRAYSQDASGRPFSTMRTSIPTTYYVLNYMMEEKAYWIGQPILVVNFNVSWNKYASLQILERVPEAQDLAERLGSDPLQMDRWRENLLPGFNHYWTELLENDATGNAPFFSPVRVVMRMKHLEAFAAVVPSLAVLYDRAWKSGSPAATLPTDQLFAAFNIGDEGYV